MKIVNIVATAKLRDPLDFVVLSAAIEGIESSPKTHWLKLRLKPENYYIAFYKSGKFLITGITDFNCIDEIVKRVLDMLKKAKIEVYLDAVTIHNVVLVDEIDLRTTLENIALVLTGKYMSYEPEQFPGLFYKDVDGVSYTLFSSGKMIVTGFSDIELAKRNLQKFKALIKT